MFVCVCVYVYVCVYVCVSGACVFVCASLHPLVLASVRVFNTTTSSKYGKGFITEKFWFSKSQNIFYTF